MDDDLLDRLDAAVTGLESTRATVDAGAPWPLATVFDTSDEAQWGPPEVLAHVAEMGRFWTGEIERILAGGPDPVPFGRISTDALRLGVIERDRSIPPRALYDRAVADLRLLANRWPELTEADRGRVGLHPRLGEMTVGAIADRFIVSHLAEHVEQLRTVTGSPSAGSPEG